jgi:hypothetical protein
LGCDRTPNALSRTRENGREARKREIPRNVGENAKGRELVLSALAVNRCGAALAAKSKSSPFVTLLELFL